MVKVEAVGADLSLLTTAPRATLEATFVIDPALQHFEVTGASLEDALANLVSTNRATALKEAA